VTYSVRVDKQNVVSVRARLSSLVSSGCRRLELADSVDADFNSVTSVQMMHLIRDATGFGLQINWSMATAPADINNFTHLFPPSGGFDSTGKEIAELWRDAYSFGTCFFRVGPSFIALKDVRRTVEAARMVIEEPYFRSFLELAEWDTIGKLPAGSTAIVDDLVKVGLCHLGRAGMMVLPYRMREWPIPFSAI
jgi:hypothetical protein